MTHYNMCGAASGGSCFVPWCTCPCHKPVELEDSDAKQPGLLDDLGIERDHDDKEEDRPEVVPPPCATHAHEPWYGGCSCCTSVECPRDHG